MKRRPASASEPDAAAAAAEAAAASSGAASASSAEASKAVLDAAKAVLKLALEAGVLGEAAYERALRRTHEDDGGAGIVKEAARLCGRARGGGNIKLASQQPK